MTRDACLAIGSPHPDATSVQHFHTELFELADAHLAPSQRLAHIDLGRILLRPTLREEAQERRFWPSLLRFLNTPHGIVAQPSEPTHASRLLARQRGDILASLKQVWTQIASEYDARTAAPHDSIGPYTTALGDAVSLAPHWDYDLLRLSVTWAAPATTRRIPARGLPHLRAALSAAAAREGVSPLVRAQLLQLHQHLSVFDVSMLAQSSPRDLRVAGLSYPSTKMAASIRQAHTYVRRFEAASNDAESDATYRASVALIALWADSQSLRACR